MNNASALVVMNWNLYRGGGDVARVREFKHRHQQTKEERASAARQIEMSVRQTWASMVSSGERAKGTGIRLLRMVSCTRLQRSV